MTITITVDVAGLRAFVGLVESGRVCKLRIEAIGEVDSWGHYYPSSEFLKTVLVRVDKNQSSSFSQAYQKCRCIFNIHHTLTYKEVTLQMKLKLHGSQPTSQNQSQ